jgi:hypothetical protein
VCLNFGSNLAAAMSVCNRGYGSRASSSPGIKLYRPIDEADRIDDLALFTGDAFMPLC